MAFLFYDNRSFNADIGGWDVSKVTDMYNMFSYAYAFNQPIGSWDVSNVTNMRYMFYYATAFSQNLTTWCVVNVSYYDEFDKGSGLNTDQLPLWYEKAESCPT
jgi:surface protein